MVVRFTNIGSGAGAFAGATSATVVGDFNYNPTGRVVTTTTGNTFVITAAGATSLTNQLNEISKGTFVVVEG